MAKTLQDLSNVTAAILAGGFGTRLRPVVADRPKALAEVRGLPFLAYLLGQLATFSIRYVVLCTGYLGEQIEATFGDSYNGLHLVYSKESSPLGTAGALRLTLPLLHSDTVLVLNGDSFCDANLSDFWSWHCTRGAEATLLLTEVANSNRYGRVNVGADGLVISFEEKNGSNGQGWINAGIYILSRRLLLEVPINRAVSLEREMFPQWVGNRLYGYQCKARFLDIGTPESYATAERFFSYDPTAICSVRP